MNKLIKNFFEEKSENIELIAKREKDTFNIGHEIGKYLHINSVISLNGDLGTGKTVITKGICSYFKLKREVSSPTFTIVNEYTNKKITIFHFDVCRLEDSTEFEDTIGLDYFDQGLCIIEWGNVIKEVLPKNTIEVNIEKTYLDSEERKIEIRRLK